MARGGHPGSGGREGAGTPAEAALQSASREAILGSWVVGDEGSRKLREEIVKIAASGSTVLIRGESGTGKDLLASVLHYLGPNADEPLVKIDCASLPLELVESELFGYEKGAFTGASQMKRGRLETAGGGTIVLDEIAALSLPIQAKLLRVIEEKKFERLGGHLAITVEARIVALTNVDLEQAVAERAFREDLYYRLSVIPLTVAPLRERRGDIRPLAERFAAQLAGMHHRPQMTISAAAMSALERYAFPGNVRELRNLIERAVVYGAHPEVRLEDLPAHVRQGGGPAGERKMSLEELERAYIGEVLDFAHGRKSRAAEILGISRKTLLEKRKKYGLD
jgi:DNA-binding NtrC family response regulator